MAKVAGGQGKKKQHGAHPGTMPGQPPFGETRLTNHNLNAEDASICNQGV